MANSRAYSFFKRAFDLTLALGLIVLFSPLMIVVAGCVWLGLGMPILFRQRRVGYRESVFTLVKFRSMRSGNGSDTQRLTFLGRFLRSSSLDELPQLFSILKGEMSFVGPRPLLPEYLPRYQEFQRRRHDVKPGLTGWAQVNGRNAISWSKKLALDVWYVENRSAFLDLKILLLTALRVLSRSGASESMPEFQVPVSVIGAGGHAKVVLATLKAAGEEIEGIYDDNSRCWGQDVLGIPVKGAPQLLAAREACRAVIAIGDNQQRKEVAAKLALDWVTVIHPSAVVDPTVRLGAGSVVMAGALIQADTKVGAHAILNTGARVDHDCRLGDFSHVGPGGNLAGNVSLGEGAFLGIGASVIPAMAIGAWSVVGAGATVVNAIPAEQTAKGTPARSTARLRLVSSSYNTPISMSGADIDESDVQAVVEVVRSGRLSLGPKVVAFEKAMADYLGVKHAIATSSGTASLHLIVRAMGIKEGDEVIVPSFTFAASVNAILYERATPVFVDIDPQTMCLDPKDVRRKITSRTKAIMVVDTFGHPVDWDAISAIAKEFNLSVIDDSCEALGASYRGKKVGSFGGAAAFAFYPNKQITTGEGGMIVTNDDALARVCDSLRNQGRSEMGAWLHHERLGYNYRMDEMSAALGLSQMQRLDAILAKRQKVADAYSEKLSRVSGLSIPCPAPQATMSWFVYVVTLDRGISREAVRVSLEQAGVPTRPYFSPIHQQPYLRDQFGELHLPVTQDVSERTLALPFYASLSETTMNRIVGELEKALASESSSRKAA